MIIWMSLCDNSQVLRRRSLEQLLVCSLVLCQYAYTTFLEQEFGRDENVIAAGRPNMGLSPRNNLLLLLLLDDNLVVFLFLSIETV